MSAPALSDDLPTLLRETPRHRLVVLPTDTDRETLALALAALANTSGGTLVVGAQERADPAASFDRDTAVDAVLQAALAVVPPLFIPLPYATPPDADTPMVVVTVPAGMPHVYSVAGRYMWRVDGLTMPIPPPDLRRLIIARGEASFETEPHPTATLDDIDLAAVRAYAETLSGVDKTDLMLLLERRGCLVRVEGTLRPTHAGLLLFGRDPQRYLRGGEVVAARFSGETMSDRFMRQDLHGTLPEQIRRAEAFLADTLRRDLQLGPTMTRDDQFEYPMEAARELVVNAVAHRDYSINGDGIRLLLFRNRMEVISPGRLPGPVTIDNIKDERFSRNPVIVQVLADMGFIERLGYGVDRVIDLMRAHNRPAPLFEETAGGFRVVLYRRIEPQPVLLPHDPTLDLDQFYGTDEAFNPRQEVALRVLHGGSTRITNSELQNLCPDVHPETIRRDLADLVTRNILAKRGQKRGSYYVLKTPPKPAKG